jgi:hypothetical protein
MSSMVDNHLPTLNGRCQSLVVRWFTNQIGATSNSGVRVRITDSRLYQACISTGVARRPGNLKT